MKVDRHPAGGSSILACGVMSLRTIIAQRDVCSQRVDTRIPGYIGGTLRKDVDESEALVNITVQTNCTCKMQVSLRSTTQHDSVVKPILALAVGAPLAHRCAHGSAGFYIPGRSDPGYVRSAVHEPRYVLIVVCDKKGSGERAAYAPESCPYFGEFAVCTPVNSGVES